MAGDGNYQTTCSQHYGSYRYWTCNYHYYSIYIFHALLCPKQKHTAHMYPGNPTSVQRSWLGRVSSIMVSMYMWIIGSIHLTVVDLKSYRSLMCSGNPENSKAFIWNICKHGSCNPAILLALAGDLFLGDEFCCDPFRGVGRSSVLQWSWDDSSSLHQHQLNEDSASWEVVVGKSVTGPGGHLRLWPKTSPIPSMRLV